MRSIQIRKRRWTVSVFILLFQSYVIPSCHGYNTGAHDDDRFMNEVERDSHHQHHDHQYDHHRHLDDSHGGEFCAFELPSDDVITEDKKKMEVWRIHERSKSIFERTNRQYTIPVYFHIIQTTATTGMVSDTRIRDLFNNLNDSFSNSDVPFDFEYQGVTRTVRSDWDNCYDADIYEEFKPALKIGGGDTLNIYICPPMYNSKGASVTGYSTGPSSAQSIYDGVVINNDSGEARLNTLVHETGHFFGLGHTFGDNTCNGSSDGDQVDDTPQHISLASQVNCHSDPSTWDTCPLLPGLDPNDNYMNYSNDVMCRTRFTQGQKERMIAQYELYRMVQPAPVPVPVSRPVPRPAPIPVPRPAPIPVPVQRPVARPVPIPVLVAPRATPTAPKAAPTVTTTTCAVLLSRCTTQRSCCDGRTCRLDQGIFGRLLGGRCFFF